MVNENGMPSGYKPENDLAVNSGGIDNEFYYDQVSKRWLRRGQEHVSVNTYDKYDYNTGKLKQEIPADLPPPPTGLPTNGQGPPMGNPHASMHNSGRYVDVLGSQRGY